MVLRPRLGWLVALVWFTWVGACAASAPALHVAIKEGSLESVRARLDAGDDLAQRDANGLMPLHTALLLGQREIALELIRRGAGLNARTRDGSTPLTLAIDQNYIDVLDLLLERKATIDLATGGRIALVSAVEQNREEMVARLMRAGAQVNRRNADGETALHVAANLGYQRMVERLLAAGADINAAAPDGRTPIHYAVLNNKDEVADLLYARGASVGPATGELGMFTTALVYRQVASYDFRHGSVAQVPQRLQQAADAFRALQPAVQARADELANQVLKVQVANAVLLLLGAASANMQARSSVSGTGVAVVSQRSTADPAGLRDSYSRMAEWCAAEAQRMDDIKACVSSDASGKTPCFALPAR